jgi:predicted ATPase
LQFLLVEGWGNEVTDRSDHFELRAVDWNDWFKFRTQFVVSYVDKNGKRERVGSVKIAKLDHVYRNARGEETPLKPEFARLGSDYVSLGQDESFYTELVRLLGRAKAKQALRALRDLAVDEDRFREVRNEPVVSESLLRFVSPVTVTGSYHEIIEGSPRRRAFDLTFTKPSSNPFGKPLQLHFGVTPDSRPPSNIHVLIGRNGSGKTTLLQSMTRSLLGAPFAQEGDGSFESGPGHTSIANIVYIGFSAFDEVEIPVRASPTAYSAPYAYIGLQRLRQTSSEKGADESREKEDPAAPKETIAANDLADQFARSAWNVVSGKSLELWRSALEVLQSDPNFASAEVIALADSERVPDGKAYRSQARDLYIKRLSSGHKIILLTITRLVQTLAERSLVIMDEPEGHLHPPLLAAFIRALSDLLSKRNGLAIIATHSPVILQEVPGHCVYTVTRKNDVVVARHPARETFAENVGVLTHSVFGLEVLGSGFSQMLLADSLNGGSYEEIIERFDQRIGLEGRALLQTWLATTDADEIKRMLSEP